MRFREADELAYLLGSGTLLGTSDHPRPSRRRQPGVQSQPLASSPALISPISVPIEASGSRYFFGSLAYVLSCMYHHDGVY